MHNVQSYACTYTFRTNYFGGTTTCKCNLSKLQKASKLMKCLSTILGVKATNISISKNIAACRTCQVTHVVNVTKSKEYNTVYNNSTTSGSVYTKIHTVCDMKASVLKTTGCKNNSYIIHIKQSECMGTCISDSTSVNFCRNNPDLLVCIYKNVCKYHQNSTTFAVELHHYLGPT